MDEINILNNQLSRIRAMNRYYHNQFLIDIRIFFITTCIFYYLSFTNGNVYAVIPIISLFGSVVLSFHAHYLIFSRNYSQFVEEKITILDGDVSVEFAGIATEVRNTLRGNVDVLVNSSGVVDFNPPLDRSLEVNAFGMQNLVALAKDLGNIQHKNQLNFL